MTEENVVNQQVSDPSAVAESNVSDEAIDWEKKYHEEVKQSKSYRIRAQEAEGSLQKHTQEYEKTRKKKLEKDGKLQQIIDEQDILIDKLRGQAEYGIKLEKDQKTELLNKLPEVDRVDFEDLPYNQLKKIIPKLLATQQSKPEIPSVKGTVNNVKLDKPWGEMTDSERRAFYTLKANEQAKSF